MKYKSVEIIHIDNTVETFHNVEIISDNIWIEIIFETQQGDSASNKIETNITIRREDIKRITLTKEITT